MRLIEQFEKIIDKIYMQSYAIKGLWGIEPNRIVLGKYVYDILKAGSNNYVYCAEHLKTDVTDSNIEEFVIGLPITVDYDNKWVIEVCYGCEADGRDVLGYKG